MRCLLILCLLFTFNAFAEDEELCESAKKTPIPEADQPAKSELAKLKDCDSESLYYGIDGKPDYPAALRCAYAERADGDGLVFGGSTVLMMLYANGYGVKKNLDLAIRFACDIEGAPAEVDGRLENLRSRKEGDGADKPFDACDDITSGLMQGHCTARDERKADVKREASLDELTKQWTPAQKTAFGKLRAASADFTEARSRNEVDLSGTARAAFVLQEEAIQKKDFLESVEKLEKKKAPKYTGAQLKQQDAELNKLYKKIQVADPAKMLWGTVSKDGIQKAQRAWLAYRDAWVAFAKIKYPSYSADSIAAWFTKKRNHMLRSFTR